MLKEYLQFAEKTAKEAGKLTLEYFLTDAVSQPEFKNDDTPVTIADRKAEELIRQRIGESYPDHQIVGEEFGESGDSNENSTHRWIIDPIDGTKSFVHGVPLYAVLLALEIDGIVEVGCAYFPALDEIVSAASGRGCHWNGELCHVSDVAKIDRAVCAHMDTAYIDKHGKGEKWKRLQQAVYYNAGWCDAYGYLLVATGRAEIMVDPVMEVWDCGPFPPILREAGGYFGDWSGNEGKIDAGEALATNGLLKEKVFDVLHS